MLPGYAMRSSTTERRTRWYQSILLNQDSLHCGRQPRSGPLRARFHLFTPKLSGAHPLLKREVEEPAGTGAGVDATGASVFGVLGALAVLGAEVGAASLEGVATGAGAGVGVGAEAVEEVFFAILCWYTLLGEVFLSIFRQYILYSFICLKKCPLLSSKN